MMQGKDSGRALGLGAGMEQQGGMASGQVEDMSEAASPEEQNQYDAFVNNAMRLMYDEKSFPKIVAAIEGGGDPVSGLGNAAAMVVMGVEESMKKSGFQLAEGVLLPAGTEILEQLADLAGEAGIKDFSEDEMETALYRGLDVYRDMKSAAGDLDQEKYQGEFAELVAADKAGTLGDLIPKRPNSTKPTDAEDLA